MRNDVLRDSSLFALAFLAAAPLTGCKHDFGPDTTGELLTQKGQDVAIAGPMAVNANGLFYIGADANQPGTLVLRLPLSGGAPVTLALAPDPNTPPDWLILDQNSVYYDEAFEPTGTNPKTYKISRVPQGGGPPETLVTGTGGINGMAAAGGQLAYITQSFGADGTQKVGTGAIFLQPMAPVGQPPATPTPLVQGLSQPCALAADDAKVYWLDCADGELLSFPLSPATSEKPAVLAPVQQSLPSFSDYQRTTPPFAVAAGQLYWFDGGAVRTMPTAGGAPRTLASQDDWAPWQLLADATAVYWRTDPDYPGEVVGPPDITGTAPVKYPPETNDRNPGLWMDHASGDAVSQVLGAAASPIAAAMDADYLYWISSNDSSVRRLHR